MIRQLWHSLAGGCVNASCSFKLILKNHIITYFQPFFHHFFQPNTICIYNGEDNHAELGEIDFPVGNCTYFWQVSISDTGYARVSGFNE